MLHARGVEHCPRDTDRCCVRGVLSTALHLLIRPRQKAARKADNCIRTDNTSGFDLLPEISKNVDCGYRFGGKEPDKKIPLVLARQRSLMRVVTQQPRNSGH